MKTIIANASSGFFARNFLRTEAPRILASGDARVVVLVPEEKLDYYRAEFREPNLIFDILPETRKMFWESVFEFIDHSSVHTPTTWIFHSSEFYKLGTSRRFIFRLSRLLARRVLWFMGGFDWWIKLLRRFYYLIPSNVYGGLFDKYRPDAVFCPTMIYHDQLVLKEAKKRKLKTIGMILSWDNLTTKTFLRVFPDHLITQTEILKNEAIKFYGYPAEKISVVGIPQYDLYFQKKGLVPWEEFIKSLGGDPNKKLIVYAFSGKAALHIEFNILKLLHQAIASGAIAEDVQVLVRPYPRFDFSLVKLEEIKNKYGFLISGSTAHVGGSDNDWEFDEEALSLITNTAAHSDLVVAIYTTFFIEGAIFDKPIIAVGFDGEKNYDYYNSARRFFDWHHLAELKKLGGLKYVQNNQEFISAINEYLKNPDLLREGRKKIVDVQCQFADGKSGERLGQTLLRLVV